jgi:endonuclease/exonuclease/phosphatase family metal-dependent hydrolase
MKRRAFVTAVAAVLALAAGAAVGARPGPVTLRVLTYNLHHGEGIDKKLDLERIAAVIKAQQPDLVALQEVDVKTRRTGGVDQAARYGELTGLKAVFGKTMDYDGGGYGNAVLSRFPVVSSKTHPLPVTAGHEPRAVLEVRVLPAGGPEVVFLATHLDHTRDGTERERQVARIQELFAESTAPTILAGDLNAPPDSPPLRTLLGSWADATAGRGLRTIPVDRPQRQIDHVLFRPAGRFKTIEAKAIDEKVASDHLPVLAVLELLPE